MARLGARVALGILLALWASMAMAATSRIALVIGNSNYASVQKLSNPTRDAQLLASTLKAVGFDVILSLDATKEQFNTQIGTFVNRIDSSTVAAVYYAGHGLQYNDENFLLPVDAKVEKPGDIAANAISLRNLADQVAEKHPRASIFILDACRNTPIKTGGAQFDQGLAKMPSAVGTFIAFATAPGAVAYDGGAKHSPFSAALASYIPQPGLPIEQVFKRVRETVVDETAGQQVPWDNTSLITDFFFVDALRQQPEFVRVAELDASAWKAASKANTASAYQNYLSSYPNGLFSDLATARTAGGTAPAAEDAGKASQGGAKRSVGAAGDLESWNAAVAADTAAAYQDYLNAFPTGLFAKLARLRAEDKSRANLDAVQPLPEMTTAKFQEFVENPLYPELGECDRLAGHVQEAADPAVGVYFKEIEPDKAVPACQEALKKYPDSFRILINYGRAIDAAGRHDEAREIYKAGADAGFPIAYRSLGDVYRDGRGVQKDLREARYWYVLGAERDNVFAELNLALIYEGGLDVPVDKSKAVLWLWRAAKQGFAPCMEKLAGYYMRGEVVPQDFAQAALLLQGSASMGIPWAQQELGELYLNGQGVPNDPAQARLWLERSSMQGNIYAQAKLGALCRDGVGGEVDPVSSLKWFYIANAGGETSSAAEIKTLEKAYSKRQIKQAKQLAADFKPARVK